MAEWAGQLLTAVLMLAMLVYLLVVYAVATPASHGELVAFLAAGHVRVPATFTALVLVWHAWLGTKSILMDYVSWTWLRISKYIGAIAFLALMLVWFLGVIWTL